MDLSVMGYTFKAPSRMTIHCTEEALRDDSVMARLLGLTSLTSLPYSYASRNQNIFPAITDVKVG
ncbi:MAG: hypothetical protein NC401_16965, partial [Ruminococcus sp.]|nr:hypothetical protein [Ruminococcus sp.]